MADVTWFLDYEDFFRARSAALVRLARFQLQDDQEAQDAAAEVLSRIFAQWRRIRRMENAEAYIRRMMINECITYTRRASTRYERRTDPHHMPDLSSADESHATVERDEMWRFLRGLTEHQRAVLVLRYYEQVSDTEIAEILGISRATVRSHAMNALRKLRMSLESAGDT
jgi:RNA polymerase sigma-70 factor (sigma-E family)